jgi:type II secretory ATPase GspE/PulE/Tfp pilus assembly ATPase PilB-like protein
MGAVDKGLTYEASVAPAAIDWPSPPFTALEPVVAVAEDAVINLRDGGKFQGSLAGFSPNRGVVELVPAGDGKAKSFPFAAIKSVHLAGARQLALRDRGLAERGEVFEPSGGQAFAVEFGDGKVFSGETIGHVRDGAGLYLYVVNEHRDVQLHFVPDSAIEQFMLGTPIGQMLVDSGEIEAMELAGALERQGELRKQRIGDFLTETGVVSCEQLALALKHQESLPILRLGEALQQLNLLSAEQLDEALRKQAENRKVPLGQILVGMGVVDDVMLKTVLATKLGIPVVSLTKFNIDPNAVKLVSATLAYRYNVMPLYKTETDLVVAIENPLDHIVLEKLRFATAMKIVPVMASSGDIGVSIRNYYGGGGAMALHDHTEAASDKDEYSFHKDKSGAGENDTRIDEIASRLFAEGAALDLAIEETVGESDNTLVQLVNKIIMDAYQDGVSDIHIESNPGKKTTRVRFRKDGALLDYLQVPANFRNALVSRIKIMCQLDISERRKPQDGKIDFQQFGPAKIELRVATIPTSQGLEDIVLRLLSASRPIPLEKLGLDAERFAQIRRMMARPYGLVLVCGPTGSGKTTTLHSLLGHINTPERKIWTAEDPVEITQPGLRQVQMNSKIGWTFATALRSFLRGDPDVIMVGEMRDQETARVATEASLTGHLVLSTLHTNSATESVTRLLDLGMDPFSFSDALLGVLAQRLVRRLCPHCRKPYAPDAPELDELALEYCADHGADPAATLAAWGRTYWPAGTPQLFRAASCARCNHTGYLGRFGVYELLASSPAVRRAIQTRAPVSELQAAAAKEGMLTLKQDGIHRVLSGQTDIHQVRAVCS